MRTLPTWVVAIAAAGLVTAGCQSDKEPLPTGLPARADVRSTAGPIQGDLAHIDRVHVAIGVGDAWAPGNTVNISVQMSAVLDVTQAQVTVQVPDVRLAEQDGWNVATSPRLHEKLPPAFSEVASIGAGQSVSRTVPITIRAPGFYRIVVSVNVPGAPVVHGGQWVNNQTTAELWVMARGQRLTTFPSFDRSVVPDSFLPRPGPFIKRPRLSGSSTSQAVIPPPARPAARPGSSPHTMTLPPPSGSGQRQAVYYDSDSLSYEPLASVPVHHTVFDEYENRIVYEWNSSTDANGIYTVTCGLGPTEIETETSSTDDANVTVAGGGTQETEYPETSCLPGTDPAVRGVYESVAANAKLFFNIRAAITGSRALLGMSRGHIAAVVVLASDTGVYDPPTDRILVGTSNIWTSWGAFVAAHEYGHAVQEKALGGLPVNDCPTPHNMSGYYTLHCAYSEGFADFHGVAAIPATSAQPYYDAIEGNGYYFGGDGSINEGAVAAFLLDLVDSANETWDSVQYPGSYVASIVKTCQTKYGSTSQHADGIDGAVFCFEQTVDPSVTSTYFRTRTPTPTDQSNSATAPGSWSRTAIRALWLHDLYNS